MAVDMAKPFSVEDLAGSPYSFASQEMRKLDRELFGSRSWLNSSERNFRIRDRVGAHLSVRHHRRYRIFSNVPVRLGDH
jgi:hypothetical protein